MLLTYSRFVFGYLVLFAKESDEAKCTFRSETLEHECDWSTWLPWSCTGCNHLLGSRAIRKRAICCDEGISKDLCLKMCGYNQTADTEFATCETTCNVSLFRQHRSTSLPTSNFNNSDRISDVLNLITSSVAFWSSCVQSVKTQVTTTFHLSTTNADYSSFTSDDRLSSKMFVSLKPKTMVSSTTDLPETETSNMFAKFITNTQNQLPYDKRTRSNVVLSKNHFTSSAALTADNLTISNKKSSTILNKADAFTDRDSTFSEHSISTLLSSKPHAGPFNTIDSANSEITSSADSLPGTSFISTSKYPLGSITSSGIQPSTDPTVTKHSASKSYSTEDSEISHSSSSPESSLASTFKYSVKSKVSNEMQAFTGPTVRKSSTYSSSMEDCNISRSTNLMPGPPLVSSSDNSLEGKASKRTVPSTRSTVKKQSLSNLYSTEDNDISHTTSSLPVHSLLPSVGSIASNGLVATGHRVRGHSTSNSYSTDDSVTSNILSFTTDSSNTSNFERHAVKTLPTAYRKSTPVTLTSKILSRATFLIVVSKQLNTSPVPSKMPNTSYTSSYTVSPHKPYHQNWSSKPVSDSMFKRSTMSTSPDQQNSVPNDKWISNQRQSLTDGSASSKRQHVTVQTLLESSGGFDAREEIFKHKTWTIRNVPSGVVVGATFGAILACGILFIFILFLLKRYRRKRNIISPTAIELKEQR